MVMFNPFRVVDFGLFPLGCTQGYSYLSLPGFFRVWPFWHANPFKAMRFGLGKTTMLCQYE